MNRIFIAKISFILLLNLQVCFCFADACAIPESPRPLGLRDEPFGRSFSEELQGKVNPEPRVKEPRIIPKKEWGGGESSGTMRSHFPVRLTLHHTAPPKPLLPGDDPKEKLRNLQIYGWKQKNWADLPYHFLIDLDGNVYEGRDPLKVGDTNTQYDPSGHLLVSIIGNYSVQAPNEKQLDAISDVMAWFADYYNINPESLRGHMECAPGTACPGKYLYPYVVSGFFEGEIRRRLQQAYSGEADVADEIGETTQSR